MIEFTVTLMYGAALGILIMDADDCEEYECDWGFIIMLGPVGPQFVKSTPE